MYTFIKEMEGCVDVKNMLASHVASGSEKNRKSNMMALVFDLSSFYPWHLTRILVVLLASVQWVKFAFTEIVANSRTINEVTNTDMF